LEPLASAEEKKRQAGFATQALQHCSVETPFISFPSLSATIFSPFTYVTPTGHVDVADTPSASPNDMPPPVSGDDGADV